MTITICTNRFYPIYYARSPVLLYAKGPILHIVIELSQSKINFPVQFAKINIVVSSVNSFAPYGVQPKKSRAWPYTRQKARG